MHPDLLNNAGVALILFLQGLGMAVEQMKTGAGNWRLHLIVQSGTNSVAYHVLSPVPTVCLWLVSYFVREPQRGKFGETGRSWRGIR